MYLSFIQSEKDALQARMDKLEEIEEAVERKMDDCLEELREEATRILYEAAEEIITEFDLENPFNETQDELEDVMRDYLVQQF